MSENNKKPEAPERDFVAREMSGICAVGRLDCSMAEFLRGLKYYIEEQSKSPVGDTHLINLLRRSACVAWELEREWNSRASSPQGELIRRTAEGRVNYLLSVIKEDLLRLKQPDPTATRVAVVSDDALVHLGMLQQALASVGVPQPSVAECVKAALEQLERIDTITLAANRFYDEAEAVGKARVLLDRLIESEGANESNCRDQIRTL